MINFIYMMSGMFFFISMATLLSIHGFNLEVKRMAEDDKRISVMRECEMAKASGWPMDCSDFRG